MANQKINLQNMIPNYWRGIYIYSRESLLFLGKNNLSYLKQYWRREERELAAHVKALQADIDLVDNKTVKDIKALASQYESPVFPAIGIPKDSWAKEPEPLDADSTNRQSGATTFNVCGWCKHHGGGLGRHNYLITTRCTLTPEKSYSGELRFNTPCLLANGTPELLQSCVDYLRSKQADLIDRKKEVGGYARYLARLMKDAEEKPYLANHRPHDYFNIGDEVMLFIPQFKNVLSEKINSFVSGKVVNGYRHHDGCVSAYADTQVHLGDYGNGCGMGYGDSRPEIMKKWEYEYLKTHPDYFQVWADSASADVREFHKEAMFRALMTEA